jgi:hypothetical protein
MCLSDIDLFENNTRCLETPQSEKREDEVLMFLFILAVWETILPSEKQHACVQVGKMQI